MVHGGNFGDGNVTILITNQSDPGRMRVVPLQTTPTSTKFIMPAGLSLGVTHELTICRDTLCGLPFSVNVARVWWMQGDEGNSSTPGGWVRVFGENLWRTTTSGRYIAPTLRLQPVDSLAGTPTVELTAVGGGDASQYCAKFVIPLTLPAHDYTAFVRGGWAGAFWTAVQFFASPDHPRVTSISVIAKTAAGQVPAVFVVPPAPFDYVTSSARNSTDAIQKGIESAAQFVRTHSSAVATVELLGGGY